MGLFKYCFFAITTVLLLSTCGSPEGKFQNNDSTKNSNIDTSVKFIHTNGATKWESDWSKENVVVYQWKAEPGSLHPTNGLNTDAALVIMSFTQRFLVSTDMEDLKFRPDLIKSLPSVSSDGLRYSYELKEEPTWDDGTQLSVDDVLFTVMAWKCPLTDDAFARSTFDYVKSIEKDPSNPRKFYVLMKAKYIQNDAVFADMPILQKKFLDPKNILSNYSMGLFDDSSFTKKKHGDLEMWAKEFNDEKYGHDINFFNGLGAYKITAWEEQQRIELTKKKNHWTSKLKNPNMYDVALPEKIIFKLNLDDNNIAISLAQQTIDASSWISTRGLVELSKDSNFTRNYHYAFVPNFGYQYMGLNMKPAAVNRIPFFTDVRVRRAMAYLTPVNDLNNNYFSGKALRMTSLVSPINKDIYDATLQPIPYAIEKAKQLLEEAGWIDTDGDNIRDKMIDGKKVQFECELYISQGPIFLSIATDVAKAMYPAGIKVDVKVIEFSAMNELLAQHKFDMYLGAWSGGFAAEDYKQVWHSTSWCNNGSNFIGFGTTQSDALIDSLRTTIDATERMPMEKRLQKIIYDEQPYVFLFSAPRKMVIHKRFDNADFYYERPGMKINNLRLMSPGNRARIAPVN